MKIHFDPFLCENCRSELPQRNVSKIVFWIPSKKEIAEKDSELNSFATHQKT